jgi:hypothetical protein
MSYLILSTNFVAGAQGQTVTDEELDGCNIAALIESGHLVESKPDTSKPDTSKSYPEVPTAIPATENKEQ